MCWACNPLCGRCKPPKKRAVTCPACAELLFFSREESLDAERHACFKCGADVTGLVHVDPVFCKRDGNWCAYPCKGYDELPGDPEFACGYRTEVKGIFSEATL